TGVRQPLHPLGDRRRRGAGELVGGGGVPALVGLPQLRRPQARPVPVARLVPGDGHRIGQQQTGVLLVPGRVVELAGPAPHAGPLGSRGAHAHRMCGTCVAGTISTGANISSVSSSGSSSAAMCQSTTSAEVIAGAEPVRRQVPMTFLTHGQPSPLSVTIAPLGAASRNSRAACAAARSVSVRGRGAVWVLMDS